MTTTISGLIERWAAGDRLARDLLVDQLHPELAQLAAARLRAENGHSLSTGDLINDAMIRLLRIDPQIIAGRAHFMALASRLMRRILIDHARAKRSDRRQHQRVELNTRVDGDRRFDLAALDAGLIRLRAIDADLSDLIEMRYFGGMTLADVAEVTGWSEPTVKRRWQVARAWLIDALSHPIEAD